MTAKPPTNLEIARTIIDNKGIPLETSDRRVVQVMRLLVNELEEIRHELNKPVKHPTTTLYGSRKVPLGPTTQEGWEKAFEERRKELEAQALLSPPPRIPLVSPPTCPDCGEKVVNEVDVIELSLHLTPSWLCRPCFVHLVTNSRSRSDNKLIASRNLKELEKSEKLRQETTAGAPCRHNGTYLGEDGNRLCTDCDAPVCTQKDNAIDRASCKRFATGQSDNADDPDGKKEEAATLDMVMMMAKSGELERSKPGRRATSEDCKKIAAHRKARAMELLAKGFKPGYVARAVGVSWDSAKRWKEEIGRPILLNPSKDRHGNPKGKK